MSWIDVWAISHPARGRMVIRPAKLDSPTDEVMLEFERRMAESQRVMQCLLVAGDIDYILLIRSRDVAHYQEFARRILRTAPSVLSYTSEIVLTASKLTTEIPLDAA